MKTIRQEPITVEYQSNYMPDFETMKDNVLYVSKVFKTTIHKCLCGCGNKVVLPLTDQFWKLTDTDGKISMTPSVGSFNLPCKSHYIITNGIANFV